MPHRKVIIFSIIKHFALSGAAGRVARGAHQQTFWMVYNIVFEIKHKLNTPLAFYIIFQVYYVK